MSRPSPARTICRPTVTALELGWSHVETDFETSDSAIAFILGAGGDASVIAPAELRATVRQAAARVVRQHEE